MVSFGQYEGPKQVYISQVVTDFELLQQSRNLEAALRCNTVVDFIGVWDGGLLPLYIMVIFPVLYFVGCL